MKTITVVGFPKCGTSALMRAIEQEPDVTLVRSESGGLEVGWPQIKELKAPESGRIQAHKFTAYIYNDKALQYIVGMGDGLFVLCIRNPAKSLVSWHMMHRDIARSGRIPEHFAYQDRDFYADCSIQDYYERYAKPNLRYDLHFARLASIAPKDSIIVVSQERMAEDLGQIASYITSLARGHAAAPSEPWGAHTSLADKTQVDLPDDISEDLRNVHTALLEAVKCSGVRHRI